MEHRFSFLYLSRITDILKTMFDLTRYSGWTFRDIWFSVLISRSIQFNIITVLKHIDVLFKFRSKFYT